MKGTDNKTVYARFFWVMAAAVMVTSADGGDNSSQLQTSPEIVLNGITTIFGDKRALFKVVDATPSHTSRSYFLSEGERSGEIELLAVDVKAGTIKVSDRGNVRLITICEAPTLLAGSNAVEENDVSVARYGGSGSSGSASVAVGAKSATGSQSPVAGQTAASGGGNFSGNADKSANNSNGGASAGSANPASDSSDNSAVGDSSSSAQGNPWWMKEAQKIEQARQETAQRVMDGKWQPYPLTPLTPPGTSSQLISSASVYFFYNPVTSGGD
jgi:hypothetical protein